jgi:hypothetical protein
VFAHDLRRLLSWTVPLQQACDTLEGAGAPLVSEHEEGDSGDLQQLGAEDARLAVQVWVSGERGRRRRRSRAVLVKPLREDGDVAAR